MIPKSSRSIPQKSPPQMLLGINSTKLPYGSLIHIHHSHGKIFPSPMQYFQVFPYSPLCLFQYNNYSDTFHSSKISTILVICIIIPPDHFTPLYQPHLSNTWGTSLVMPFLCLIAISKATPSYKNHLAFPLFQIDLLPYITLCPQDQINIPLISVVGIPMPLWLFLDTKLFDQIPYVQLSSKSTDML